MRIFWQIKAKNHFLAKKIHFFQVIPKYRYLCRKVYRLEVKGKKRFFGKKNEFFPGDPKISLFMPKCVYFGR